MDLLIRKLDLNDLEALWALRVAALQSSPESFGTTYDEAIARGPQSLRDNLAADGRKFTYLGAFDSKLVGMLGISRHGGTKDSHKADIVSMYVDLERRGNGIGGKLIAAAIDHAELMGGIEQLCLAVVTTNHSARKLYAAMGFAPWGIEPRALKYDGQYWDEEHMVRRLTARRGPAAK